MALAFHATGPARPTFDPGAVRPIGTTMISPDLAAQEGAMAEPQSPSWAETHISWVLLTEDRALKFAKPVVTDVVDQGDVERRRAGCRREVALNARLSPDVYLGAGEVVLDGRAIEPVIVMRRMPEARRLTRLLDSDEAHDRVREIARVVASFHARTEVLGGAQAERTSGHEALVARWRDDLAGLRGAGGEAVEARAEALERRAVDYVAGRRRLLSARIDDGMVRDGHGDLLADDIFCLDDGPRILDCLAFSADLRCTDVLADVGFLVMDLQRLGHPELGRTLLRRYCELTDEHHPGSLAHFYVAQRALVRAKVAALRHRQRGDVGSDVGRLLELSADHLARATVRVVMVGGLPGSGKSTLADELAGELGWAVLSSDEIRRDLGLRYEDLHDELAYDATTVHRVYDELRRRAGVLVDHGMSVVLDATWTSATERAATRELAGSGRAEVVELRCDAPPALCRRRVAGRSTASLSEATPAVVDVLGARVDPWPEAIVVDTASGDRPGWAATLTSRAWWWHPPMP